MDYLVLIFVVSLLAFSISALCGGGAGLMLIPVLGLWLPVSQVPAALSIGTFTSSLSRLMVFRKQVCWRIVVYFVPAALPAVWLGAWLLKFVNPFYLELVMGLFLVSNIPFLFSRTTTVEPKKTSNGLLLLIGFLAGFLSGLTGAVGLLFNKFYLQYGLSKEEIIATRAANEILLHVVKLILYTLLGLISSKVIGVGITIAIAAVFSSVAMKWLLPYLSDTAFKKIGYSAMILSGVVLLAQSGNHLWENNQAAWKWNNQSDGLETKLQWQKASYALEFTYDEGFEYEQQIPISELTSQQQTQVLAQQNNADKVVIEMVYMMTGKSYEAYYFKNQGLIKKIDFN